MFCIIYIMFIVLIIIWYDTPDPKLQAQVSEYENWLKTSNKWKQVVQDFLWNGICSTEWFYTLLYSFFLVFRLIKTDAITYGHEIFLFKSRVISYCNNSIKHNTNNAMYSYTEIYIFRLYIAVCKSH